MNIRTTKSRIRTVAIRPATAVSATPVRPEPRSHPPVPERERGDVPGWVMITMMTAIVVIVLLGVFQDAVVNAIQNAFDSIQG